MYIVVDLDNTICNCDHRTHLAKEKRWEEFHAGLADDKPNADVVEIVQRLAQNYSILFLSGRSEKNRAATKLWLRAQGLIVDGLLLRPDDDRTVDHELKPRLLFEHFGSKESAKREVLIILEDRDQVVKSWRDHGFNCWQVREGTY
jgi:hypothetical protein